MGENAVTGEVIERIHKALSGHPLERTEDGYRLVHPGGAGISTLRLLPSTAVRDGMALTAIAEITAEYAAAGLPQFHPAGVQRLNSLSVHGAYQLVNGGLRQTARFPIYAEEPAVHLVVQSILNAFGGQLPLGRSTALATQSSAIMEQQRAHHGLPTQWQKPLSEESLAAAKATLQQRGLAAANNATAVWAELALSGNSPSRTVDPQAETAVIQVHTGVPHPIAGAGYLAAISLPPPATPGDSARICARLNELELQELDYVPSLGAWGLHASSDLPAYSCFFPAAEPWGELHMVLMWWCVRRAAWLREKYWVAGVGIPPEL